MSIGKAGLADQFHHGRLQTMAPAGTIFDYNIWDFLTNSLKEFLACCNFPVKALSQTVSAVAPHSHGFVIINFHIAETAVL